MKKHKQTVLITGSNGLLGQQLVRIFTANHFKVIAFSRGVNRNDLIANYDYYNVNITNFSLVNKMLHKLKPDIIINAAALTNVDICELRKRECEEINFKAVENLIISCKKTNIHLIHISTDFIFDGNNGPYLETDKPAPINHYGVTKWKAEKAIVRAKINATILRTILVYGLKNKSNKSNIVLWIKDSLEAKKQLNVVTD